MIDIINRAEDEFPSLLPLLQEFFRWLEHSGVESHPGPKVLTYACAPKSVADYLACSG
jgi:hypothetical protein